MWESTTAATATNGKAQGNWKALRVSIDSRSVQPGDLFVAIKGDRFDGHAYVAEALSKGAAAAMVSHIPDGVAPQALLVVPDTMKGLVDLAAHSRAQTKARVVGITGSVGKTSTKEALAMALSAVGLTYYSKGNFNNHIGLPLNMANLPKHCDFAIFEMGMNHPGEILSLTKLARPEVSMITTVESAHLEFFPSEEAIADAKAEIFEGMQVGNVAVLNRDNRHFAQLAQHASARGLTILSFGESPEADCRLLGYSCNEYGSDIEADIGGTRLTFRLGAVGRHWGAMAVGILAIVHALKVDLAAAAAALANFRELEGRGRLHRMPWKDGHIWVVDDSYNASPASMRSAFAKIADIRAHAKGITRTVALLGDMLELGTAASLLHARLLSDLQQFNVDTICATGPLMKHLHEVLPQNMKGLYAPDASILNAQLPDFLQSGDLVLIKGSHGSRMYEVARELLAHNDNNHKPREKAHAL